MKRQAILIISIAAVFVLLLVGYFVVVRPVVNSGNDVEQTTVPETEEGEALGISNRFFIFESLTRDKVKSIYVNNASGEYTFVANENNEFHLDGYENIIIDTERFASLVSVSTYTLSKTKIKSQITPEKLDEFGLTKPQAYWIITDLEGNRFKVNVGDKLLTGGGYYCQFEGRNSVYVLDTTIENTVLVPIEKYVKPVMVAGITKDDFYTVDNFTVFNYAEPLLRIRLVDKKDQINKEALAENIMDYPTAYYPNSTLYYDIIYGKFLDICYSEYCYKLGATDKDFEEVGLDVPAHTVAFQHQDVNYVLMFSEKTEEETYYVVSNLYPNVIGVVEAKDYAWLENKLINWIDEYVFQQYITDVAEIHVESDKVNADFSLKHYVTSDGKEDFSLTANGQTRSVDDVANFRQYYKSYLSIAIYDYVKDDEYCSLSADELEMLTADENNAYLKFTYKKNSGAEQTLAFYRYSTRHSLVTIDGVGEFYVLTDLIQKIENDTIKMLNGETVTAHDKN